MHVNLKELGEQSNSESEATDAANMNNSSTEILTASTDSAVEAGPSYQNGKGLKGKKQILVGWDRQRSFTFVGLAMCLIVWACIFFPLLH